MKSNIIWGLFFILIGIFSILLIYGIIPVGIFGIFKDFWGLIIAAIFIVIGLFVIFSKSESKIEGEKRR